MKIYTVLEPPDRDPDKVIFIPEGFAWAALLFTVLWALWHRMWLVAAALFALIVLFDICENVGLLGAGLASLLQFGIALLFGFEARALQANMLEKAGYQRAGLIPASSREAAEVAYFADRTPMARTAHPMRIPAASDDMLGMFGNV